MSSLVRENPCTFHRYDSKTKLTHAPTLTVSPTPLSVYTRLKALEDRLIQLEEYSPAWAAFHFDQPNRETWNNPVLRDPPPVTVVTGDAEGRVVGSAVPSLGRGGRKEKEKGLGGGAGGAGIVNGAGKGGGGVVTVEVW